MSGPLGTAIIVLGGVGLFRLGMTAMTDGLKPSPDCAAAHLIGRDEREATTS